MITIRDKSHLQFLATEGAFKEYGCYLGSYYSNGYGGLNYDRGSTAEFRQKGKFRFPLYNIRN
jgi:hypothetical protein